MRKRKCDRKNFNLVQSAVTGIAVDINKARVFLFVGLHFTFKNFKVRQSEKKKKINK